MTPISTTDPAADHADRRRRGRRLTLIVVLGTAALFFWSSVQGVLSDPARGSSVHLEVPGNLLSPAASKMLSRCLGLALDALLIFLLCRFAFRGGRGSTGCLAIFYSMSMLGVVLVSLSLLVGLTHLVSLGSNLEMGGFHFKDVGHNPGGTLSFLLYAAWTTFACWVLVYSADARVYREACHRERLLKAALK